jgi:hypothetical protein
VHIIFEVLVTGSGKICKSNNQFFSKTEDDAAFKVELIEFVVLVAEIEYLLVSALESVQ